MRRNLILKLSAFVLVMLAHVSVCFPITTRESKRISDERLKKQIAREKKSQTNSPGESDISVMWNRADLAEEFARKLILEFTPCPESTTFNELNAKYYTLYKAYIVNCDFNTEDAYGKKQKYKIQMKIRILPSENGELHYEALDLKELR